MELAPEDHLLCAGVCNLAEENDVDRDQEEEE
jgi:hypothetical protein